MNNLLSIDNLQSDNLQEKLDVAHVCLKASIESCVLTIELQTEAVLQSTWSSLSEQF